MAATAAIATEVRPAAGLAAWLGVLIAGLFLLNTAGGWVRLSGSGVAIPHWPAIELDGGRRTLLPPLSAPGWDAAYAAWQGHQETLRVRVEAGTLPAAALGRQPADIAGFRAMFLIEWCHRLLAAAVGLLAVACLGTALRDPGLRRLAGAPLGAAVALIGVQAVLGAVLIGEGTATRWLFLHQGNAALIVGCVLWTLLRLLDGRPATRSGRLALAALAAVWLQLMLGGMVAADRAAGISGAIDIAHRVLAAVVAGTVVAGLLAASPGSRLRLAMGVAGSFAALEAVLGIGALLLPRHEIAVPLAHQFLGMCLFLALVLAWFDARREEAACS
jgi:cytochrome c oxidase assembly protein subunit 15